MGWIYNNGIALIHESGRSNEFLLTRNEIVYFSQVKTEMRETKVLSNAQHLDLTILDYLLNRERKYVPAFLIPDFFFSV